MMKFIQFDVTRAERPYELMRQMAQLISQIGSPPLITLTGAAFLFFTASMSWLPFIAFVFFSVLLPLGFVVWLLQKGVIGDMHMQHRRDRIKPLIATCLCNAVGLVLLSQFNGAEILVQFAQVQCVIAILFLLITPWFKISLHSASAAVLFALMIQLTPHVLPPAMMLMFICWSRVFLKRHTPLQVFAGCVLGSLTYFGFFF